jgi:putative transcriptional regulator
MGVLHDGCLLFYRIVFFLAEVLVKNKLRELRAAKEWSQSDLADKLGVSRQTVNAIETEKYDPSLPLAFKVARLFKSSIEEIFEFDGN